MCQDGDEDQGLVVTGSAGGTVGLQELKGLFQPD